MNRLPLKIHNAENKSRLTKSEIKERQESEVKMPGGEIVCPDHVKSDVEAFKKWNEVTPILIAADLMKPSDSGSIARYCSTYSEYIELLRLRSETSSIEPFPMSEEIELKKEMEDNYGKRRADQMWKKLDFIFSSQAVLAIDKAINQKLTILLTYENHSFLNILSRVKNVIKKEEKPENPLEKMGLSGI